MVVLDEKSAPGLSLAGMGLSSYDKSQVHKIRKYLRRGTVATLLVQSEGVQITGGVPHPRDLFPSGGAGTVRLTGRIKCLAILVSGTRHAPSVLRMEAGSGGFDRVLVDINWHSIERIRKATSLGVSLFKLGEPVVLDTAPEPKGAEGQTPSEPAISLSDLHQSVILALTQVAGGQPQPLDYRWVLESITRSILLSDVSPDDVPLQNIRDLLPGMHADSVRSGDLANLPIIDLVDALLDCRSSGCPTAGTVLEPALRPDCRVTRVIRGGPSTMFPAEGTNSPTPRGRHLDLGDAD